MNNATARARITAMYHRLANPRPEADYDYTSEAGKQELLRMAIERLRIQLTER